MSIELPEKTSWREQKKELLRSRIIESAFKLFEERGLEQVSVDDIVALAGIAKGTFYLYFKSKNDIFQAMIEKGIGRLEEMVKAARKEAASTAEDLEKVIRAHLDFFDENKQMIHFFLGTDVKKETLFSMELSFRYRELTTATYQQILRKGMAELCFRKANTYLLSLSLFAVVTALIHEANEQGSPFSDMLETALDFLYKGIGATPLSCYDKGPAVS